jgi:hypothetical protein
MRVLTIFLTVLFAGVTNTAVLAAEEVETEVSGFYSVQVLDPETNELIEVESGELGAADLVDMILGLGGPAVKGEVISVEERGMVIDENGEMHEIDPEMLDIATLMALGAKGPGVPLGDVAGFMPQRRDLRQELSVSDAKWPAIEKLIKEIREVKETLRGLENANQASPAVSHAKLPGNIRKLLSRELPAEAEAIRELLANKDTPPKAIMKALEDLRVRRRAVAKELKATRDKLRKLVTIRQEVRLVLLDILD